MPTLRFEVFSNLFMVTLLILASVAARTNAQDTPAPRVDQKPGVTEKQKSPIPETKTYTAAELKNLSTDETSLELSNAVVTDELVIDDDEALETLKFTNVTFDDDVFISGAYQLISFEHCQFKRNVDFYLVETLTLVIRDSDFLGAASFNVDVSGFQLRKCDFSKLVSLYGATFDQNKGAVNLTYLSSREPIRVFWSQFGPKWLDGLKKAAEDLGDPSLNESNRRHVLSELEFWKDNFSKLGHHRDVAEVNYEIIQFASQYNLSPGQRTEDKWISVVLSWPSRYGTRPYRPLWLGLLVILAFGFLLWVKDPFVPTEPEMTPRPREPRLLFAMLYSLDTFLPVVEVTGVKEWGWRLTASYRWIMVFERILGLLILYAAAYSVTYYVL